MFSEEELNQIDLSLLVSDAELLRYVDLARERSLIDEPAQQVNQTAPEQPLMSFGQQLQNLDRETKDDLGSVGSLRNALKSSKTKLFDMTFQEILRQYLKVNFISNYLKATYYGKN